MDRGLEDFLVDLVREASLDESDDVAEDSAQRPKRRSRLPRARAASYDRAKEVVRELGISSERQYRDAYVSGLLPLDMPAFPRFFYPDVWSIEDFFGSYSGSRHVSKELLNFHQARALLAPHELADSTQYKAFRKSHPPMGLPSSPRHRYAADWVSWSHFLSRPERLTTFDQAKAIVRRMNISSKDEYQELRKAQPELSLPADPWIYYRSEWISWTDFWGRKPSRRKTLLTFEEARQVVQSNGLKSSSEYATFRKANPSLSLPADPNIMYAYYWKGWADFLGNSD